MLIATPEQRVVYLSETYEGTVHDKRIADEEDYDFGKELTLLQDLGFQGYQPDRVHIVQPQKKPRGKELTPQQKTSNREKSRERVVVEHAIGGVKVWRIVKEQIRSWLHDIRDKVMYLACGLHNFRLACRAGPIQP